jgi:hypothetical protein
MCPDHDLMPFSTKHLALSDGKNACIRAKGMAKLLKTHSLKLMSEAIGPSAGIAGGRAVEDQVAFETGNAPHAKLGGGRWGPGGGRVPEVPVQKWTFGMPIRQTLPAVGGAWHGCSGCAHAGPLVSICERARPGARLRGGRGSARAVWRWTALSRRGMVEASGATRGHVGRAGGSSVCADLWRA